MSDGIRAALGTTSPEGLNFVVPSDELRRKRPSTCRIQGVRPYAGGSGPVMVGRRFRGSLTRASERASEDRAQGSARVIRPQHPLSLLGAVIAALALSVGASAAAAKPKHPVRASHPLTKKQRASVRHRLQKRLRSNPGSALSKDFI